MRQVTCIFALGIGFTVALAQTPEAVVRQFLAAFNAKKPDQMAKLVKGANLTAGASAMISDPRMPTVSIEELKIKVTGATARATFVLSAKEMQDKPEQESLKLIKKAKGWLIEPERGNKGNLNAMAQMCCNTFTVFEEAKEGAIATACSRNLKQLAIAIELYVEDQKGKFALTAVNWPQKLHDYTKNHDLLICPKTGRGVKAFEFNSNLAGKSLGKLADRRNTVMLYEGKGGKLTFHPDGTAGVAFADGTVRRVNAVEAKKLRWKP